MFSGPDLVAAVKQRRWAKWTEIDHFVRFLLFIYHLSGQTKEIPANKTNWHKHEFVYYTGDVDQWIPGVSCISSFLLVQASTCANSQLFTEGMLEKVWCFPSSMRVSFGCHFLGRYELLTELVWQRVPGCSWADVVHLDASECLSWPQLQLHGTEEKLLLTLCGLVSPWLLPLFWESQIHACLVLYFSQ